MIIKMEKKYNCEVIQDLLPLYQDNVCSASSGVIVKEHLAECPDCNKIAEKLKSNHLEENLIQEKNSVLQAHFKKERKLTFIIGLWTSAILMIPVIVCLICNLAIGHGLDWFFIVLTALLLTASITVVPLMVREHTGLWTLGCFTASLLLLLLTICIYAGGHWFFLAAVPVLFGLSVVFMPYVVCSLPLPAPLANCKGLFVMIWDTLWLYALIVVCGLHAGHPGYWRIALEITTFCLLLPWTLFVIIRYVPIHPLTKAGICTLTAGIFCAGINNVLDWMIGYPLRDDGFVLVFQWILGNDINIALNDITSLTILLAAIPVGIALIVMGCIRQQKKEEKQ